MAESPTLREARPAVVCAVLCWAGFALAAGLVGSHRSDAWDAAGLLMWRQSANVAILRGPAWLGGAARDFTQLGGPLLRNLLAAAGGLALVLLRERARAAVLALTVSGAWLLEVLLKLLVGRARPVVVPHLMNAAGNSFPSGHSFNAATVYIALALAVAPLSPRPLARGVILGAAMLLSLLVAFTRVMLGVHFPTDAIGGWLGGAGWAFLASALFLPRDRRAA